MINAFTITIPNGPATTISAPSDAVGQMACFLVSDTSETITINEGPASVWGPARLPLNQVVPAEFVIPDALRVSHNNVAPVQLTIGYRPTCEEG